MDDRDIIALYNARDEEAIRQSTRKYGSYVMGISQCILGNDQDAEECVNDTWLKAWNSIPPQDPPSLKVYLGRLVRHLSIDRLRTVKRLKRNREMVTVLDELTVCSPPEGGDENALGQDLNQFLGRLNVTDRKLFVGRYWYCYSVTTLAETYGMSANSISVRLHRIRQRLKEYLIERGYRI